MSFFKKIIAQLKAHYDKIIAFIIFAALVGSLIYLAIELGLIKSDEQDFNNRMNSFKARYPNAEVVDTKQFADARKVIFEPFMIDASEWTNSSLFLVDQRFWCYSCEKPVPWEAEICPFCSEAIEKDPDVDPEGDMDGDGLTYAVEDANRMNPSDPSDAHMDFDNDGFDNYEELMADPPTDIRDPKSIPPIESKLKVDALGVNPFRLRFKSKIKAPDGSYTFGLNLQRKGQQPKTYFKRLNDDVEGFTLMRFEEKFAEDSNVGKRDISVLTLKRGSKEINLVKDKDIQHNEYLVRFYFQPDDIKFIKSPDQTFEIRDRAYKVISVDTKAQNVVIMRLSDNSELTIKKLLGAVEAR